MVPDTGRRTYQDGTKTDGAFTATGIIRVIALPKVLNQALSVFTASVSPGRGEISVGCVLELVRLSLPRAITLDPHADRAENHLLAPSKVNTQLDNVPIFDRIQSGWHVWLAEAHVVQESPGRTPDILDVPLGVDVQELAVPPTHNFGLEANGGTGRGAWIRHGDAIALRVTTDTDHAVIGRQGA